MKTHDPQSLNISDQTQSAVFMQCTPSNKRNTITLLRECYICNFI